jgi:hypothetical protein
MQLFSSGQRFDPRRYRPRSWAQKNHVAIGLGLGALATAVIYFRNSLVLIGWPGRVLIGIGALALYFSWGFSWNRGPIFPPSPVNRSNLWKYLILLGLLWLIILPLAWSHALHAFGK